jgi:hypothetical protein
MMSSLPSGGGALNFGPSTVTTVVTGTAPAGLTACCAFAEGVAIRIAEKMANERNEWLRFRKRASFKGTTAKLCYASLRLEGRYGTIGARGAW